MLKRTVSSVLGKYFLILVMTQQITSQSSIEGYAEAYGLRSEKGEKEVDYKDAYKEDGTDYAESVVDYMHQALDKKEHKEDSHEHDTKGNGKSEDSKKEKNKEANKKHHDKENGKSKDSKKEKTIGANKKDQHQNDYNYHHHGDYEYMDEPENEEGHLDPEVGHIIIEC